MYYLDLKIRDPYVRIPDHDLKIRHQTFCDPAVYIYDIDLMLQEDDYQEGATRGM